jgi:plastocyanin
MEVIMPFHRQHRHPWALTLLLLAACGGDGGDDGPGGSTLESIEVSPSSAAIFSLAPGNTATLSVVAKDGDGNVISDPGTITYTSGNTSIATVSAGGVVTAAGAGTTSVTASATYGGVTRNGSASITVNVAPATAMVNAQLVGAQPSWVPGTVDVSVGGQVTWTAGAVSHNISFTSAGSPSDIADWADGSQSTTFPTAGTFAYVCTLHAGMQGSVRVH